MVCSSLLDIKELVDARHLSTWLRTISVRTYSIWLGPCCFRVGPESPCAISFEAASSKTISDASNESHRQAGREQHDEVFVDVQLTVRLHYDGKVGLLQMASTGPMK